MVAPLPLIIIFLEITIPLTEYEFVFLYKSSALKFKVSPSLVASILSAKF